MQLYKLRDFGELFTDTIDFVKENFVKYIKLYFRILILPIVFIIGIAFLYSKYAVQNPLMFEVDGDPGATALVFLIFFLLMLAGFAYNALSLLFNVAFMVSYHENKDFGYEEIKAYIKSHFKKAAIMSLVLIPVLILLMIPVFITSALLIVTIIGILALPFVMAWVMVFMSNSFYEYVHTETTISKAIGFSWETLRKKPFLYALSTGVFIMLIYFIIAAVFTIPLFVFGMSSTLVDFDPESINTTFSGTTMLVINIVSALVQVLTTMVIYVNLGMIYFTSVEQVRSESLLDDIDSIGDNSL